MNDIILVTNDDDVVDGEFTDVTSTRSELPTIEQVQRRIEYLMELATKGKHSTTIGNGELREYFKTPPGYTAGILRWSVAHPTKKMLDLSRSITMEDE